MSVHRLYSQEELASLYRQTIETNKEKLVRVIKPAPWTPFTLTNIVTQEQIDDWSSMNKDRSRKALVEFLLQKDTLLDYIQFSRAVEYIKESEARKIFEFIPDLCEVGLHDPIPG